ncbi:DUF2325 domain-containing protein [Undibacterium sp. TS12]|uniref:DUF2325 domain-containing protein n=1 Tax=Undibacterium sp. TS12 TaxID=2908202 RepID=UPI001F4D0387|nr:DUF2325 domain-containing protein [Undibacterium sp. TS12]MCH8622659.1 DUF2325 domain-containing protein [Undibacterium sp. TS12]
MCDQDSSSKHLHLAKSQLEPVPAAGSRRRRIWDLSHECHCPVVGVCIPLAVLRRIVNKAVNGQAVADDYEIHVGAIAECGRRNRLSEALQQELEQRYARTIQVFRTAKTTEAVTHLWLAAIDESDVAGAFWAALTHPRCTSEMQDGLCRDMHMLQHQAGASVRIDIARFNALLEQNKLLTRELSRVQERHARAIAEKSAEIEKQNARLIQLRAENIGKDSSILFLSNDLNSLKTEIPELDTRQRLQKKIEHMSERQGDLENQVRELRQKLAEATKAVSDVQEQAAEQSKQSPEEKVYPITLHLQQKTVLCVGGRSGNVPTYRDLVERIGGRFAHHDGGLEDNQSLLDASLAAADLVICQTGCISHTAYWRVKDFCKRTGKRCVFVENPSVSSLARGLEQFSSEEAVNTETASW